MAKRTSAAAKRKARGRKSKQQRLTLNPGVGREIAAIGLVALTVLLLIAFFGGGGFLIEWLFESLKSVIGLVVYILPLIFIFLAWSIFRSEEEPFSRAVFPGIGLVIMALSGLFHFNVDDTDPLSSARAGTGGGLVGYVIRVASFSILNATAATIIWLAVLMIGLMMMLNIRLSDLIRALRNLFKPAEGDDFATIADRAKTPKMTINAQVPLVNSSQESNSSVKEDTTVLTTSADPDWELPSIDLLVEIKSEADAGDVEANAATIKNTLASFSIEVAMEEVNVGPTVTQYTLRPPSGVKMSRFTELDQNLAHDLAAVSVRVEAPIPGRSAVGIEVPNKKIAAVHLREIMTDDIWKQQKAPLSFALGRDVSGKAVVVDLADMPHLLVAGATGSGKSIMINSFLLSLLYRNSPSDLRLILVDPKQVELSPYRDIPHLLTPIITEPEKCISALKWSSAEMERRYSLFAEQDHRNIDEYNAANREDEMPYIMIVIDELADFMMKAPAEMESLIVRIAQKARATGIHLILATQRPSVNVITGLIKANIPARIAFSTIAQVDSRTIIDQAGAEKLLGRGDMLFQAPSLNIVRPKRLQGVMVEKKEVQAVVGFLRAAKSPEYNEEVLNQNVSLGSPGFGGFDAADDHLFNDAAQVVIESGKASASLLQRRLRVGYARAARLIDLLEERGIVGPADGARPREVLASSLSEVSADEPPLTEDSL